ncbi:MAG: class I SAM-dependent methyltransferase [Saprospiraceae bacterium]|nr:class I SAM-dependent methyltransferase [Saprospiraceae bacterium]
MDKSKIAVAIFNKLAKMYQDKFMNVDLYSESFDLFCNAIQKENATILEIACGPGNITKYLLNKRPDFNILGIDLAPQMIELAKINNPTANFLLMDCRQIESITSRFDGIMCGFCLPYLTLEETHNLINNVSNLLNLGGILYLSTMEGDYNLSGLKKGSTGDEIFMHFYQAKDLRKILISNAFEILKIQHQKYPTGTEQETMDLVIIAKKI